MLNNKISNTYNPLTNDVENNIYNENDKNINNNNNNNKNILLTDSNFIKEFVFNTLIPNIESANYIKFRGYVYSYFHKIHMLIFMILQLAFLLSYSNHKDNILFSLIGIMANLNLIWFLISFSVYVCTKNLENEVKISKQVDLDINNAVHSLSNSNSNSINNCNKLLIKIFEFWFVLISINLVEFISLMISINGLINLIPYFFANKDLTRLQIILAIWIIDNQLFIIDTFSFRKLKIYS